MQSIHISELINAGVNFTIEDENSERGFSSDGELFGIDFELIDYVVYDIDVDDNEPLCDINELRDSDDRWAHVGDSHVRELELQRSLYKHLSVDKRDHREYGHLATWRKRRYEALHRYATRCTSRATLVHMRKGVWSRYVQSCKGCAVGGTWWALYLTKVQVDGLMQYMTGLINTM